MYGSPFDKPGRFWKGNLHAHSTRSDGRLSPDAVVDGYRSRGYDFLSLTDHFLTRYGCPITDTQGMRSDGFTTILGAELHGPALENGGLWHIVAVGLPLDFAPAAEDETGPELAMRAVSSGAFVGIAHPAWNGVTPHDALSLEHIHAVEIHNEGHTADSDRGSGWYLADLLATKGHRISTFAADDAHFGERPDSFGGWVHVRAEENDPAQLLAALKVGSYYASTGPELHDVRVEGEEIVVRCTPAARIYASGRGSVCKWASGSGLTEARFPVGPFAAAYYRVTVIDAQGKKAWSNPVWFDEVGS